MGKHAGVYIINIFTTIGEEGAKALKVLNLPLTTVRDVRATRVEMSKRAILHCYLHKECGYNFTEIGFYTHKEHSTVRYSVLRYAKRYEENRKELLTKIQEL